MDNLFTRPYPTTENPSYLEVWCNHCGNWFVSRYQIDESTFLQGCKMWNNSELCRICGEKVTHDKKYMELTTEKGEKLTI